jgi:hypothetical protein
MFQLKSISKAGISVALEKAERYRLLNEPWLAESICFDILEVEPQNTKAIIVLLLAMTDQFGTSSLAKVNEANRLLRHLPDEYQRHYYAGIISEREGKADLNKGTSEGDYIAYDCLRNAMDHYENAEAVRPPGNDDAILRWNTCARLIMHHHLEARNEEYIEPPLE